MSKFIRENDSAKFEVQNINNKVIAVNCIILVIIRVKLILLILHQI